MQNIATAEESQRFETDMHNFLASEGADWVDFWLRVMESLWTKHRNELPELFHDSLADVPMHENKISFLERVNTDFKDNARVLILSDANKLEIKSVLKHKGLESHFHDIIAHESGFDEEGKIWAEVRGRDRRKECLVRNDHLGMCKGLELRKFLTDMDKEERPHVVVYCGDGSNDFCGVLGALGERDYVLALEGAALHRKLDEQALKEPGSVKPKVLTWKDGAEMEALAMEILNRYST